MSDNSSRFSKDYKAAKTPKSKPTEKGTVIYDPRGQWDHPGQITKIPGGNITMQDVNYPVLGVDNFGNQQMMYPGMDYTFPNADNVTEYPQMSKGGMYTGKGTPRKSTSQNIQTSINPLMTRNTTLFGPGGKHLFRPSMQTGGWLDKYQDGKEVPSMSMPLQYNQQNDNTVQPKLQDPYLKSAYQQQADKLQYQDYLKSEQDKKDNELKTRLRIRQQNELDKKRGVAKGLYDEDYLVNSDIKSKEYQKKIEEGTNEMMLQAGLAFLPVAGELAGARYLPNAYKYNPLRFKPNPDAYYRMLGETGFKDAVENNVLRQAPKGTSNNAIMAMTDRGNKTWFNKGMPMNERIDKELYKGYKGPDFVEYTGKELTEEPYKRRTYAYSDKPIPVDKNSKFYREHWLKGYEEIPNSPNYINNTVDELPKATDLKGIFKNTQEPVKNGFNPDVEGWLEKYN